MTPQRAFGVLAVGLGLGWLACAGQDVPDPAGPDAGTPVAPGPPQPVGLAVRDLLAPGEPPLDGGVLLIDGIELAASHGELDLELAPGRHTLAVRRAGYRSDLFALRFGADELPRGQAVGTRTLAFDLRPGDEHATLWLVGEALDVRFFLSLLDRGVSRRWLGSIDLHVDRTRRGSVALPTERVPELAAFVKSALEEVSGGALTLGRVTTGTGLDWEDFLHAERRGAITVQFGSVLSPVAGREASGWGLYREGAGGTIRSGNVIVDLEVVRNPARDFRPWLGHELGHALSLQHPSACRTWSRMDPGVAVCDPPLQVTLEPEAFWSPADKLAGKLIYTFLPGTDFRSLPVVPPAD